MTFPLPDALLDSGRFVVRACLGAGGFGVVYAAHDRERGAEVALKWLRHGDPAMIARFKREFRSLADLTHPNLVQFRDLFSIGDDWFFTMDLLEGVDLLSYVRPGEAPPIQAAGLPHDARVRSTGHSSTLLAAENEPTGVTLDLPVDGKRIAEAGLVPRVRFDARPVCAADLGRLRDAFAQLALGLSVIHDAGLLHRDVKPSNVIVTRDGRVVLLDFGLVAPLGDDGVAQSAGDRAVGTPAYMSPEQALGSGVTAASDWYAVGVMLYQALTGEVPIQGTGHEVLLRKHLVDPIAPPQRVRGVPPPLSELCMDLLKRAPEARPNAATFRNRLQAALPSNTAPELPVALAPPDVQAELIGREAHLWALEEAMRELDAGHSVVALVHGISGVGKSALLRHFVDGLRRTRPEALVFEGRCYEREAVPYKALDSLVDAIARYLVQLPESESSALLPRDLALLARVFPVFLQLKSSFTKRVRPPVDVVEERRRAFVALRDLLHRLGEKGPLVLYVDDLQWADADSEPLLYTLLRGPDAPLLFFAVAYRSDDAHASPVVEALRRLGATEGGPFVCDVPVGELSAGAARTLAAQLLGNDLDATTVEAIVREAGGSPLFLRQLAALGGRHQTVGLAEAVRSRMAALPNDARRLLEVLALYGKPMLFSAAAHAAGVADADAVLRKLQVETLARSRTRDGRTEVETYHDRIREVVAASLSEGDLVDCHGRIARALAQSKDSDAEALAVHYLGAREADLALRYAREAAERASRALAFDRAARLFEMALELESSAGQVALQLLVKLAEALASAGRGKEAAERFLQAAAATSGAEALDLTRRAAEQFMLTGHLARGRAVFDTILNELGIFAPKTAMGALVSLLLRRLLLRLRGLRFRPRSVDSLSKEQLVRIDLYFSLARGFGVVDPWRGMDFQTRYLLASLRSGEPMRVALGIGLEAAYRASDGFGARKVIERLLRRAEELAQEHPHASAMTTLMRGAAKSILGDFVEGAEACERAVEQLRERCTGVSWELSTASIFSHYSRLALGRLNEMRASIPTALGDAQARGDLYGEVLLRTAASWFLRLASDDVPGAREELEFIMVRWSRDRWLVQHGWRVLNLADVALYAGEPQRAYQELLAAWPHFRRQLMLRTESIRVRTYNCRARAALAFAVQSKGAEREALLREARTWARRIRRERWPLSKGFAAAIEAGVVLAQGDAEQCARLLQRADEEFTGHGAMLYAWAARARRAQVRGVDDAPTLATTLAAMRAQGIASPARMLDVFAPGGYPLTAADATA